MSEYVTAEDLDVPDCECGHHPGKHQAVPHHYSARLIECECRKTADDLDLAHLDSVVRREVAKALREFAIEQQQYVWQPSDTRRLPEDEQAAYVVGAGDAHAVVERLADKRADEIEGGQS